MIVNAHTVAFQGIEVIPVEVQAQISSGLPSFQIVGLPDKAVSEARERVKGALQAIGLALPPKRVVINMAPADVAKEGSHFDLPIAVALLGAMEVIPKDFIDSHLLMGELGLDGKLRTVAGVLPSTMFAYDNDNGMVCPADSAQEAAWVEGADIIATPSLLALINHIKGTQVIAPPSMDAEDSVNDNQMIGDLSDIKGQETAKRALEIAAAGGHNMLMSGPPGSGKSMLASRLPSILPNLEAKEALEVSTIHSISGLLKDGKVLKKRPYRAPHHSASLPALVGGGHRAQPGEISLAHNGVLFLDELPEFSRSTLEALRQPLEEGEALIARVNYHVSYPADFQLIAAMNPCKCGYLGDSDRTCHRAPKCATEYQSRLSGPLLDRIDLFVDVPPVSIDDLDVMDGGEPSTVVLKRVEKARDRQIQRQGYLNCMIPAQDIQDLVKTADGVLDVLKQAAKTLKLSARAYHRVLRLSRTIADLEASEYVEKPHIIEALSFRRQQQ